jgi:hypothetical protein
MNGTEPGDEPQAASASREEASSAGSAAREREAQKQQRGGYLRIEIEYMHTHILYVTCRRHM